MKNQKIFVAMAVCLVSANVAFANYLGQLELKYNSVSMGKSASVYLNGQELSGGIRLGQMTLEVNPDFAGTWGQGDRIVEQAEDNNDKILAFCVDVTQGASSSFHTYGVYEAPYDYITPAQTDDLLKLFGNYFDDVTDDNSAAAFQFSIWEIINETSGVYDISNTPTRGSFYTKTSGDFTGLANNWLNNLGQATPGIELQILANPKYQDFGITAVPEPFTMISLALGSVVVLSRSKRRKL